MSNKQDRKLRKMFEVLVEKLGGEIYWSLEEVDFHHYKDNKGEISKLVQQNRELEQKLRGLSEILGYRYTEGEAGWRKIKKKKLGSYD